MSRTRAERRHLSRRAQSRRRDLCGTTKFDRDNGHSLVCGNKMTPGGEAKSCGLCETCKRYDETYYLAHQTKKLSSFILAQD